MKFGLVALLLLTTSYEVNAVKLASPTGAQSKTIEDEKEVVDWGSGKANGMTGRDYNPLHLAQTERKAKMVTNSYPEVEKALAAEKAQLLLTPDQAADNNKDAAPSFVQLDATPKAWPQDSAAGPTNTCVNPVEIEHPPTADGRVGGPPCTA